MARKRTPAASGLQEVEAGPDIDSNGSKSQPCDRILKSGTERCYRSGVGDHDGTQGTLQAVVGEIDGGIQEVTRIGDWQPCRRECGRKVFLFEGSMVQARIKVTDVPYPRPSNFDR